MNVYYSKLQLKEFFNSYKMKVFILFTLFCRKIILVLSILHGYNEVIEYKTCKGGFKMLLTKETRSYENEINSGFFCMKQCNACTCIHNLNGHCASFTGDECDLYEVELLEEN